MVDPNDYGIQDLGMETWHVVFWPTPVFGVWQWNVFLAGGVSTNALSTAAHKGHYGG